MHNKEREEKNKGVIYSERKIKNKKSEVGAGRGSSTVHYMIMNIFTKRKSNTSQRIWSKVHHCAKVHQLVLLLIISIVVR